MSIPYYRAGEMAPLTDKITGGSDHPSDKVRPYQEVKIDFDGSEFFCRLHAAGRDWCLRNINYDALRAEVRRLFPRLHLRFKRTRAADLAVDPAAILQGRG